MLARRLAVTTASAAMLLSLLAAPPGAAAAGGRTIRVDDDGHASPTDCGATATAPHRIQAAVDSASRGDTIVVCPGTYRGWVEVRTPDLTIRGERPWTATLLPGPAKMVDHGQHQPSMITVDGADGVRIQWLRFLVQAPVSVAAPQADGPACGVLAAIRLRDDADGAVIRGNRMRAQGKGTLGMCGYGDAVLVEGGSSANVAFNAARDFRGEAFAATDPGTWMTAFHNSIRFWHKDVEQRSVSSARLARCTYGAGVVIGNWARGTAVRNRIVGLPSAATGRTPLLCPGIYLLNAGGGVVVRDNLVRWTYDGINTAAAIGPIVEGNVILDSPNHGLLAEFAQDGQFADNVVRRSGSSGIEVGPTGPTSAASGYGIAVAGELPGQGDGTGNRFLRNDAFGSGRLDCADGTVGSRSHGTGNTWRANRSDGHDSPDGICPAA